MDNKGKSVVQSWVQENCTFKMQAVLLSALRGCDGIVKEDPSKALTRKLRQTMLLPAVPEEINTPQTFMSDEVTDEKVNAFLKHLDAYPNHFVFHFAHACEIVGYKHPDKEIASWWYSLYWCIIKSFHCNVETIMELDVRLADV